MKVLILSCNTGGGHNSAALAARDAFVPAGHEAVFLDVFSIASQKLSGRVSRAYLFSTRLPFLFHLAYWAGKKSAGRAVNRRFRRPIPCMPDGFTGICRNIPAM